MELTTVKCLLLNDRKHTDGHSIIYHLATMLMSPKNDWLKF